MAKRLIPFIPFIIALCIACDNDELTDLTTNTVVVESYLFAGHPVEQVKLTKAISVNRRYTLLIYVSLNTFEVN